MFGGEVDFVKKALEASKKLVAKESVGARTETELSRKGDEMALERAKLFTGGTKFDD